MPITSLAHIAARRTRSQAAFAAGPTRPTGQALLDTIGMYIPTDVTAMYVPVAAGLVAAEASGDTKKGVAVGVAVLAAFGTWVIAHKAARSNTPAGDPQPSALETLKQGWYEVLAAAVAFMIWAWAMPGSWHDFGKEQLWLPALVVGVASLVIGGGATLLNREPSS